MLLPLLAILCALLASALAFIGWRLYQTNTQARQQRARVQELTDACAGSLAQLDLAVMYLEQLGRHVETETMRRQINYLQTILQPDTTST
jgi:hypothetical protein